MQEASSFLCHFMMGWNPALARNRQAPQLPDPGAVETFVDHLLEIIATRKTE